MALKNDLKNPPKLFDNKILRLRDVAQMLGYSEAHVYRLVQQKKIPYRKKGKNLFFFEKELFDWLDEGDFK